MKELLKEKDGYYFINSYGQVMHEIWTNNPIDNKRYEIGNLFKTQEECEFAIEKLKVIAELKKKYYLEAEEYGYFGIGR